MKRAFIFAGVLVVAVVAIFIFLRDDGDTPATLVPDEGVDVRTGDEVEGNGGSEPVESYGSVDGVGTQTSPGNIEPSNERPSTTTMNEQELSEVDVEQQERERLERVEAFHAQNGGPISCETVCDCPESLDCQIPPGICVPSGGSVFCCTDEACPEGRQCVRPSGRLGTCGEN